VTAGPIETRSLGRADAGRCDDIVGSLPYFFGDPDGIDLCRRAVREEEGLVALIDGDIEGFLTFRPHFAGSAEITWMAVHARHRRRGIGRALIERLVAERADAGDRMLFVLTLGPSVREDGSDTYEGTRRFYRALGFVPLREFGLREWNSGSALVLARSIVDAAAARIAALEDGPP
jgi:GNAT superfamily N-acetyltransferase